ncbi:MAG: AAA family ATPase [Nitrososphaerales archaeon]
MLSEKYRPNAIAGLIGNEGQRLAMIKWLKYWKRDTKPLLLTGPPGVGKSTSIYAVARELGYTVIELNASDVRTKNALSEVIGPSFQNSSLFGDEKLLIFLDEIDGISGRSDYAGIDYVLDLIENTTHPLAMAANVEDIQKLKKISQKSLVLRFKAISEDLLLIYLSGIATQEEIKVSADNLKQIIGSSRGDVRQALNTLQTISGDKIVGSRTDDQFTSDSEALDEILSSETFVECISKLRQFDAPPFEKLGAIFDSVVSAKNLSIEAKAECLEKISKADVIFGKINRGQSWRLLRYLDKELALAVVGSKLKRVDSSIPWNLRLSIWNDGRIMKGMEEIIASEYHSGRSTIAAFFLPYFAYYFKSNPASLFNFLKKNEFGDSEKRVLLKMALKAQSKY